MTHELLAGYHACGVQNPQDLIFLSDDVLGILRFERNAHKPFFLCGYSFQNELGFQRDGNSFGSGSSNRGEEHPVGRGIQRGQRTLGSGFQRRRRCLGGRHPMEGSALRGRKNPMKPAVSWHTILLARSSVLYLCEGDGADRRFRILSPRCFPAYSSPQQRDTCHFFPCAFPLS